MRLLCEETKHNMNIEQLIQQKLISYHEREFWLVVKNLLIVKKLQSASILYNVNKVK